MVITNGYSSEQSIKSVVMNPQRTFHRLMLKLSLLSWLLVSLMPVLNAHGNAAGVWATLCTINGFELVKIEDGKPQTQHNKPCPFAHFSNFHHTELPTTQLPIRQTTAQVDGYTFLALSVRFESAVPRAPPVA
ncbi:hypothetical protein FLL98_14575 [Vibrio cholerae]|nr:hypothetical protein [Vibrio cholerae]EGR3919791.1 hypothetical protein [Vibrio cholerae]EGR4132434.1 hypothetical protein [Vibrio cholerae]TQP52370.1 hypothetical protein FLL98_14575 [Vibrio cholerae]TQP75183.1 hypothetical protein FLL91_03060 [Vibrio cholerae]